MLLRSLVGNVGHLADELQCSEPKGYRTGPVDFPVTCSMRVSTAQRSGARTVVGRGKCLHHSHPPSSAELAIRYPSECGTPKRFVLFIFFQVNGCQAGRSKLTQTEREVEVLGRK